MKFQMKFNTNTFLMKLVTAMILIFNFMCFKALSQEIYYAVLDKNKLLTTFNQEETGFKESICTINVTTGKNLRQWLPLIGSSNKSLCWEKVDNYMFLIWNRLGYSGYPFISTIREIEIRRIDSILFEEQRRPLIDSLTKKYGSLELANAKIALLRSENENLKEVKPITSLFRYAERFGGINDFGYDFCHKSGRRFLFFIRGGARGCYLGVLLCRTKRGVQGC